MVSCSRLYTFYFGFQNISWSLAGRQKFLHNSLCTAGGTRSLFFFVLKFRLQHERCLKVNLKNFHFWKKKTFMGDTDIYVTPVWGACISMSQSSCILQWRLCEQSCWCNKRTLLFWSLIRGPKHLEAKCDLLLEPPQQRNHSSCRDPSVMRRTKRCLSVLLWARMKDKAAVKRLSDITKDFATSCFLVKIHWFDCEHVLQPMAQL